MSNPFYFNTRYPDELAKHGRSHLKKADPWSKNGGRRTPPPLQSDAQVTPFGVNRRNLTGLHAGHTVVIISVSHCEAEFHE